MMKVLVLGIDEFIGRRVAVTLAASGWAQVLADPAGIRAAGLTGVSPLAGTAADAASMHAALAGVDAVVNCVSSSPGAVAETAARLFAAAARAGTTPLIVHISSMAVYGAVTGDVREDAPTSGELGPYAQAKVDAEALAKAYPRHIILRPGCEYGPGGELWSGRIARWLRAGRMGDIGALGDGYCNLVFVDDISCAVLQCLRRHDAIGAAFNLAMPDPPTWNEYFIGFARALGAVPVKRITRRQLAIETRCLAFPLKALEIVGRRAGAAQELPPPIPASLLRLTGQEIRLDSTCARQRLDVHFTALREGLAEAASWYGGRKAHRPAQE